MFQKNLLSLNLNGLSNLETVFISGSLGYTNNSINQIDVTNNLNLKKLNINYANISELDLTQNTNLENLNLVYVNNLSNSLVLDLTENISLQTIYTRRSSFNSIDCSNSLNLKDISIESSHTIELDFSNNPNLERLVLFDNGYLKRLDLKNGNNTNITEFSVSFSYALECIQVDDVDDATNASGWSNSTPALSINDYFTKESISLYPMPIEEMLNIETNAVIYEISIYDLNGQILKKYTSNGINNITSINLKELTSGVYIAKLFSKNSYITKRIIKR